MGRRAERECEPQEMQMMPTLGILVKMTFGPDKQGWQGGREETGTVLLGSTQYGWDLSLCCVPRPV